MSRRFIRSLPNLGAAPGRVLVCEDSDELRGLLVRQLARDGSLEVVGDVATSREALEAVFTLRPDALVLDLMLGDTEPDEMLLSLAAVDARPLVIVFSGLDPAVLSSEVRAVVDVHLDKTTPLPDVAATVARTIAAHRAGERL